MKFFKVLFLCVVTFCMSGVMFGQNATFVNADNIALGGYDVVSYHQTYDAVRGDNTHTAIHNGATYYFSNSENQEAFEANPHKYLPAYGGYCAFAMAMKGAKAPTDPQTFKIRDGKLYLFYNDFYEGKPFNTMIPWNADEKAMIAKADQNWKSTE